MKRALLMLTCFALAGCGADPLLNQGTRDPDRPAPVLAAVGDTIRLTAGAAAEVVGVGLRISFEGISEDSRCPSGVDCVWSGDAVARLRISVTGGGETPVALHTHLEPRESIHGAHLISLLGVEPYPVYGEPVAGADYVVLLRVTRP